MQYAVHAYAGGSRSIINPVATYDKDPERRGEFVSSLAHFWKLRENLDLSFSIATNRVAAFGLSREMKSRIPSKSSTAFVENSTLFTGSFRDLSSLSFELREYRIAGNTGSVDAGLNIVA